MASRLPMKGMGIYKIPIKGHIPLDIARQALARPWLTLPMFTGDGPLGRVPDHYKKFFWDWKLAPKAPVHYIPEEGCFKKLPTGEMQPVENVPLGLVEPDQLHQGIWGGEAVVKGFKKKKNIRRHPYYWYPSIKTAVLYSEILDKYMNIMVTERTLRLVDEHYGFDNYILQTPAGDLMSELALKLKREMYLALARGTLYPDNPAKREEVLEKYKKYMIPEEEADWYGLTLREAGIKQRNIEDEGPPEPLKHAFRKEFIEYLKNNKEKVIEDKEQKSSSSSWISSMNPFAKK